MISLVGRCGLVLVVLFGFVNEGYAGMFGFGKTYEVELFPQVRGRIVDNGIPLEGVKVLREATYDDADIQETLTAADGSFSFPPWVIKSRTPGKAFVEDRLRQVVVAEHQGEKYVLWYYVTGRISGERVVAERLGSLICDLQNEETDHHFTKFENPDFTHDISSICRW